MKQTHFRNTFITMHRRELTYEERQMVLESHMFIKDKLYGKIKGRTVAGENRQRVYITKDNDSLTTVATQYSLLKIIFNAEEIGTSWVSILQTHSFSHALKRKNIRQS